MSQKLYASAHLLETFIPYHPTEDGKVSGKWMIDVLKRTIELGVFSNVEIPTFYNAEDRKTVKKLLQDNGLTATEFVTPYLNANKLKLDDLDENGRKSAVELVKKHLDMASETGVINMCIPSGADPGDENREAAKKVCAESMMELVDYAAKYSINVTIEPLDRYAHKKALIGPIEESIEWFKPIHEKCPNTFIHWDSSHEALGKIDLMKSLEVTRPYLGQFHLCDAIVDENHPCYGDWHMDCALKEENWQTEGFLTPEVGAAILKKIASYDHLENSEKTYVSVEICGHKGDHLWEKLLHGKEFLFHCAELAGVDLMPDKK